MFAGSILQSLREINRSLGEDVLTVHFDKESPGDKDHSTTVVSLRVCLVDVTSARSEAQFNFRQIIVNHRNCLKFTIRYILRNKYLQWFSKLTRTRRFEF